MIIWSWNLPAVASPADEGLSLLVDLVDRGIIRILDLVFIGKEPDGTVIRLDPDDIARNRHPGLDVFDGASSGLLSREDIDDVAAIIQADAPSMAPYMSRAIGTIQLQHRSVTIAIAITSATRSQRKLPRR